MLEEAGRDATEAFEDVGHSDEARELLGPMYLGDFVGEVCLPSGPLLSVRRSD
jgi:cytochrome b involved in lipid metabolism